MGSLKIYIAFLIILCFKFSIYAQNNTDRKQITANYDLDKLNALKTKFSIINAIEKEKVLKFAKKNNLDVIIENEDGGVSILTKVLDDGTPIYTETFNTGSAATINTDKIHPGGIFGLALTGEGINLGIWDGGLVRSTHQELANRVQQFDFPENLSNHATHVSGTMIASGVDPIAKGMAYEASLTAYDFQDDLLEMLAEAANGMIISNHSYGLTPSSIPVEWFGAYLPFTRNLDQLLYNAPNYLAVFAAGNSNNANPTYNPTKNGYDLISGYNLAKNILSVANVEEVTNYVDATSVQIWQTSSWGPTDDGRIKPDISAKGRLTYSSIATEDDAYSLNYTGTSMAAASVTGSIGLLQQHYKNMYGSFLNAASVRALVIHTAREAGLNPGPDYIYGWGLMDNLRAAEILSNLDFSSILQQNLLSEGQTLSFNVEAVNADEPLVVTIAWTDPPGTSQDVSAADDITPRLVNDLDVKVTAQDGTTVFLPWELDVNQPDAAAIQGDNTVDNVEKIEVQNAVGTYTIEVSHKGVLQNSGQNYSLIVSGVAENDFVIKSNEAFKSVCANTDAFFDIEVESQNSFNSDINLSVSGLPITMSANFSSPVISNQDTSQLQISGLDTAPLGEYPFTVTASAGSDSYSFNFSINIKNADPLDNVVLISPDNQVLTNPVFATLNWNPVNNANAYEVDLSTSQDFNDIIFTTTTAQISIDVPNELDSGETYHWRVRPKNDCIVGNYEIETFTVTLLECPDFVFSQDTPITIADNSTSISESVITLTGNNQVLDIVADVNVYVNISHTRLSDLVITLQSPNGTTLTLLDRECSDLDDLDVTFDGKGTEIFCNLNAPGLLGLLKPEMSLFGYNGESLIGDWKLTVTDNSPNNGGVINSFGIQVCSEDVLSDQTFDLREVTIYPNPSTGIFYINLNRYNNITNVKVTVFNINGKNLLDTILTNDNSNDFTVDLSKYNSGLYFLKIESNRRYVIKKLILN